MGRVGGLGPVVLLAACAAGCAFILAELIGQGTAAAGVWAGIFGGVASIVAVIPRAGSRPRAITDDASAPAWAVSRPAEVLAVAVAVLSGPGPGVTLLSGAPGTGKTTLTYLVRADGRIQRRFGRSVYRITVGRAVTGDAAIAAKVNQAIRLIGGEGQFTEAELAGRELGALLDARGRCLLIVDDIWTSDQLAPFTVGGRRCARLVTSRTGTLWLTGGWRSVSWPTRRPAKCSAGTCRRSTPTWPAAPGRDQAVAPAPSASQQQPGRAGARRRRGGGSGSRLPRAGPGARASGIRPGQPESGPG